MNGAMSSPFNNDAIDTMLQSNDVTRAELAGRADPGEETGFLQAEERALAPRSPTREGGEAVVATALAINAARPFAGGATTAALNPTGAVTGPAALAYSGNKTADATADFLDRAVGEALRYTVAGCRPRG